MRKMELSQLQTDPQVLLKLLPEDVWILVFGCGGSDFQLLETCLEATNFFQNLILRSGRVSIAPDKIVPSVFRQLLWNDGEEACDSESEPILLLLTLVQLKPRITTFDICIHGTFTPSSKTLNSFLNTQKDALETFYITCIEIRSTPLIINFPKMSKLRDLKMIRRVIWDDKKSLHFVEPVYNVLHALENLTLSIEGTEEWTDFLPLPVTQRIENISNPPDYRRCQAVKHLRLFEYTKTRPLFASSTLRKALFLFPNMVSVDIPAMVLDDYAGKCTENLKRLTMRLSNWDIHHKHFFDVCITGYDKQVCSALLNHPDRDPQAIRNEIEVVDGWVFMDPSIPVGERDRHWKDYRLRCKGLPFPNLANFQNLEVFRIKSDTGQWGPTAVSCPLLLSMKSLKTLEFCDHKPIHIPEDWMLKMEEQFTVVYK